jgi:hypothetical protein
MLDLVARSDADLPAQSKLVRSSIVGRNEGYYLASITAIEREVASIAREHDAALRELGHPNNASVRKIHALAVLRDQGRDPRRLLINGETNPEIASCQHLKDLSWSAREMARLRDHRFTGPQWRLHSRKRLLRPFVMSVTLVEKRNERPRIEDRSHGRRRWRGLPRVARCRLFDDRSDGPSAMPTYFANASSAFRRCDLTWVRIASRTILPFDRRLRRDSCSSTEAVSSSSRMVRLTLIRTQL